MAKPIVSAERLRELFFYDPETGIFTRRIRAANNVGVGDVAGGLNAIGYWQIMIDYRSYLGHRLAWLYVHGRWPADMIDHIDGQRDNNKICNLREATRRENAQNQRKAQSGNTSGLLGVSWDARGAWRAQININGKVHKLGRFQSADLAHQAYLSAKREHHATCTI